MVRRLESTGLEEFEGVVESVEFESQGEGDDMRRQYHMIIKPTDREVGGATKRIHEWISMSAKCTEEVVPTGSVMDRFLQQAEIVVSDVKRAETLADAFGLLKDKKFKFKRIKLGREFEGHAAKEYFVPVAAL